MTSVPVQEETPIRPASTLILVRDAETSFEILMLKRTTKAAFASGMYVFPGGRIEADDGSPDYRPFLQPMLPHQAKQHAALDDDHFGAYIAAIRETFEESGVLMAKNKSGAWATIEPQLAQSARRDLHDGILSLIDFCRDHDLRLAVDELDFYNRWTTPPGRPRRFDTRFFIGVAPPLARGKEDGIETTDAVWISPGDALARHEAGDFELMAVTVRQLAALNDYESVSSLKRALIEQTTFPHYQPPDYVPT